jgi:regulator of replication initiation timing
MSKNTRAVKEYTREQRLVKENKQLKRELSHLRKQISRLDLENREAANELSQDHEESINDNFGQINSNLEHLKKIWKCDQCEEGHLEIALYPKMGTTWYYRFCVSPTCKNRTVGQRYDEKSVKGILKK